MKSIIFLMLLIALPIGAGAHYINDTLYPGDTVKARSTIDDSLYKPINQPRPHYSIQNKSNPVDDSPAVELPHLSDPIIDTLNGEYVLKIPINRDGTRDTVCWYSTDKINWRVDDTVYGRIIVPDNMILLDSSYIRVDTISALKAEVERLKSYRAVIIILAIGLVAIILTLLLGTLYMDKKSEDKAND